MFGYTGKILRVDLTGGKISTIKTEDYEQWGGGHGLGSAIFFDLVADKTIDGFDPGNVVTIMTSPLSGTLTPGCSSRTEVQGIGVQSYPTGWFTRSNFGGRFSSMLKYAGWDGIVVEGVAEAPSWVDIRNGEVQIRSCDELSLWGKDTWECQQAVWEDVAGAGQSGSWITLDADSGVRTTQRPAVLAIGPAGETLSRMACLIHDAGCGSGQGGFGAVWGAKNLKAISVLGTGGISIHDPNALMEARIGQVAQFAYDFEDPKDPGSPNLFQSPPGQAVTWESIPKYASTGGKRPQACIGCHSGCRRRFESGLGNGASCAETTFYMGTDSAETLYRTTDLLNRYGINVLEAFMTLQYLRALSDKGVLGAGKEIDCPLDFDDYGSLEFIEQFFSMIIYRNDGLGCACECGDAVAEGAVRAAERWGRLEEDLRTGDLLYPYWGFPAHYDPRAQLEWGYGTILGDRDINEHCFMRLYIYARESFYGGETPLTAEEIVAAVTQKMVPFQDDPLMLDYSTENMYSKHMAKLVAWHRYYTRFWKQSMLFCDNRWPDFINPYAPGCRGSSGEAEPMFLNAVTGKSFTFLDGIETGRKIWNLDQAIWTLQGRHRDMVAFAQYVYDQPFENTSKAFIGRQDGRWAFIDAAGRKVDREQFENFKTLYYELEGWDPDSGYPTRGTLESLGMGYVADELEARGKLGTP